MMMTKVSLLSTIKSFSTHTIQGAGNKVFIGLVYFFCCVLNAQDSKITDINKQSKLYFNMGEQGGWVPFHANAETGRPGVFTELAQLMEKHSGIQFIPVNLPSKRAEKAFIDGLVDFDFVCLEWLKDGVPGKEYLTTESFFVITEHLVSLKKNSHLFPTRESMFNTYVGTIAGYFYFDDTRFMRTDFLNERQLMLGLKHERFKVIIMEKETAKYWAHYNKTEIAFPAIHSSGNLLMRVRKENRHLIPILNQGIRTLKSTGRLKAILESYGVESQITPSILN